MCTLDVIGIAAVLLVHFMMTSHRFRVEAAVVGANPAAAVHAGLDVARLTLATFALAGLVGLAGSVAILGVRGIVRADWHPAYGLLVVPLVFLARFNGYRVIALRGLLLGLSIGGESASRRLDLPHDFSLSSLR